VKIVARSLKPLLEKCGTKGMEPCTRALLETVNGFREKANMMRFSAILKARWLGNVYRILELVMQKCIVNVELSNRPPERKSNCKHKVNHCRSNNGAESFKEINTLFLMKPFCYKTGLVPFNGAIGKPLNFVDPFAPNQIIIRIKRH
jgi:hypothetical protein